jgi:HlyD family secretion protein
MKHRRALSAAALLALSTLPANAQEAKADPKKAAAKPAAPSPTEHVAKAGPFEISVELDALFTARKQHRVSLTPKAWKDMTVLSVLPHGSRVKKGDRLLTLDTKKLNKAIEETELAEPAAKLTLKLAEAELTHLEKSTPPQLEAARRAKRIADDDWAHYEKIGHAEALKSAQRSIQFAQQSYDYAKEEFEQLKKMYEADDLTEETEEIILKRAKNSFERATESLRLAKMRSNRELKVLIPRQRIANKAAVESGNLSYGDTVHNLPRLLEQKRFAVEKARRDRVIAVTKLRDLKADLASFDVRSPADGIVYYGISKNGKWITAPAAAKKLVTGGKLSPRERFITVAETGQLGLAATVPEEKLAHLKPGLSGTATPVSAPSLKLPTKVASVNYIPGAFAATLNAETDSARLFPGMKAKVKLSVAKFDRAITVPNNLIDGDSVWVSDKDGKKQKRKIKAGLSDGKVTVILKGLKEGEKIVSK